MTSQKHRPPKNTNRKTTLANRMVTGLAWYTKIKMWFTLILGVLLLVAGGVIRSTKGVPITAIDATVTSVTWDDKEGCASEFVKRDQKSSAELQWKCHVVASYGSGKSYQFSSVGGAQYFENTDIKLYRRRDNGVVSHVDPNAWKVIGWFLLGIGAFLVVAAVVWILICHLSEDFCAVKGGANLLGGAVRGAFRSN